MYVKRCQERYDGRWCRNCGKCTCVKINEHGSRVWDTKNYFDCPLHSPFNASPGLHPRKIMFVRETAPALQDVVLVTEAVSGWGVD